MLTVDPTTAATRRAYPSVSLLVPVDGDADWPARLRSLQRTATDRLRAELGPALDQQLVARLAAAVEGAAAPAGARSLAVYVNDEGHACAGLDVVVRERVVIDDTFATRDLVHQELRSPAYWVLGLSLDDPWLLRGNGARLQPSPLTLPATTEHPSSSRDRRGKDRTDVLDARRARRLRALDVALAEVLATSSDPLIVLGAEPTLARFLDRTRHIAQVEAVLRRAPVRDRTTLRRILEPALAEVLDQRRTVALERLDRAVGAGTVASGISDVWRHRRRLDGLLLVEAGYEQPARITAEGTLEPAADPAEAGTVDDIVDDLIELALGGGARVELLPDKTLTSHERIAYVPRARGRR